MNRRRCHLCIALVLIAATSFGQARFRSGVFLHHSTGGCIWGPNGGQVSVPGEIAKYNRSHGLTGSDSLKMVETWWPSGDNEWVTWHNIFENKDASDDISSFLAAYPVIMIKSCFPSSNMSGPGSNADTLSPVTKSVANYKWHWRSLISMMKERPQNFFVIWTNAPLVAGNTNASEAALSDAFCTWAKDTLAAGQDPLVGTFPNNVFVFDFFHKLAGADGMLPLQYAAGSSDSHPNAAATTMVAPQLVQQMSDAALEYESSMNTGLPVAVTLNGPPDNATNQAVNPTLGWFPAAGATSYWLEAGTSSGFATGVVFSDSTLTGTEKGLEGLSNNTTYYWHVRAENAIGAGEFSPTRSFTTGAPVPPAIRLVTPLNNVSVSSDTVRCVWRLSPSWWDWFEISTDSSFAFSTSIDSALTDTSKVVHNLRNNTPYYWRVRGGNPAGWGPFGERRSFTVSFTAVEDQNDIPPTFVLNQNYPNPFNPSTTIRYELPGPSDVRLSVYDLLGREVSVLVNERGEAGAHEVELNASGLSSGVYFYRIHAGPFVQTRTLSLVK